VLKTCELGKRACRGEDATQLAGWDVAAQVGPIEPVRQRSNVRHVPTVAAGAIRLYADAKLDCGRTYYVTVTNVRQGAETGLMINRTGSETHHACRQCDRRVTVCRIR
jgi:hypothetical protein